MPFWHLKDDTSSGIEVHLGVNDDVDILAACQDEVEAAESDIIAPTVTAEDPLALLDETVRKRRCRCIVHDC